MLDDRLDALLRDAREPEPADDGFTDRVMASVGSAPRRRRGTLSRYVTRPAVLAAAAALITGGALAAVNTAQTPERTATAKPAPGVAAHAPAGASDGATAAPASTTRPVPAAAERSEDGGFPHHRDGDLEWGYRSEHTAYAIDHGVGLELVTEAYTNAFSLDEPNRVTLTLTNVGDEPVGIYAPEGCPLSVAAYHRQQREPKDPSAYRDPLTARPPSEAKVWNCAGDREDPGTRPSGEPEKFVLAPGESRTEHAAVFLPHGGEWHVLGQCRCWYTSPSASPEPTVRPTQRSSGGILGPNPDTSPPSSKEPVDRGRQRHLFTPPIRVEA